MLILLQKNSKQFKQLFHKKWGSRSVIPQSRPGTFILLTVHKMNQEFPNSAVSPLREVLHHLARCRWPARAGAAAMGFGEKVWGQQEGVQQDGGQRCV